MSDDKNQTGRADRERINIHEAYELRYWSRTLGCTQEQLKQAVAAVGPMVNDVRVHVQMAN